MWCCVTHSCAGGAGQGRLRLSSSLMGAASVEEGGMLWKKALGGAVGVG